MKNRDFVRRMLSQLTTEEIETFSNVSYKLLTQRAIDDAPNYPAVTSDELKLFNEGTLRQAVDNYRERTGNDTIKMSLRQIIGIFQHARIKSDTKKVLNNHS